MVDIAQLALTAASQFSAVRYGDTALSYMEYSAAAIVITLSALEGYTSIASLA